VHQEAAITVSLASAALDEQPTGVGARPGLAFVCHPYHRGGVTRWMLDAAAEWRRHGPAWFVAPEPRRPFVSAGGRPTMADLVRALPAARRPELVAPRVGTGFELGTRAYRAAVFADALDGALPPDTPCIVSDDPSVWEGAARVAARHPMIGVLHGDDAAYYELATRYAREMSRCVAVSHRIAGRAQAKTQGLRIETIPCGIPLRECAVEARAPGRARLVWVGRIEERVKRVSDLSPLVEALLSRGVDFTLDIVGDGPDAAMLRKSLEAQASAGVVRFHGWWEPDRIHRLLCDSDVLVLPSNSEGMPVVLMEALAAGCAVVASRVSGVEDAEQPPLVMVHDVGDTSTAAALVELALQTPGTVRRASASQLARERFSIAQCVAHYREVVADAHGTLGASGPSRAVAAAIAFPLAIARRLRHAALPGGRT
jgi:glycosyltransferase involved in cell wall biosynthesis